MQPPTRAEQIDYLVRAKFPNAKAYRASTPAPLGSRIAAPTAQQLEYRRGYVASADAYAAELSKSDGPALRALYDAAVAKYWEGVRQTQESEEAERQYNQPYAVADFRHWARSAYWSVDEGTAVLLGRSPGFASFKICDPLKAASRFAASFVQLHDLLLRASQTNQLKLREPTSFVAWAKQRQIEVPAELDKALEAFYGPVERDPLKSDVFVNLGELSSARAAQRQALTRTAELESELATLRLTHRQVAARVVELEAELAKAKELAAKAATARTDKTPGQREADTMRKLIIGMAMKGYAYDPDAARNPSVTDIANDLALLGISVDADTVRTHLSKAAELLPPPDAPERGRPPKQ